MLTAINFAPGVVKDAASLDSEGQWIDADKIRFRVINGKGQPQVMGGHETATADTFAGKARAAHSWEEIDGAKLVAIGTHAKLYVMRAASLYDITPIRDDSDASGALTDPFSTTNTSATVTVAHTAHGMIDGDTAYLKAASAVGGITFGAAGTHASDPFQTVENSDFVIVNHTAHGLASGEFVTFASATATGGIAAGSLNTTHRVYKLTDDAYQIQVATAATSTATGGGTPTYEYYHEFVITYVDANSYTVTARTAATSTVAGGGGSTKWKYEINTGREVTAVASGYSTGTYSSGLYSLPSTETDLRARVWRLSNYGENLLANYQESAIFRWQNNVSQSAAAIAATDAPAKSIAHITTPERFLMTLGTEDALTSTFNPLQVAWATQEGGFTTNDWTAAATNTAGDILLAEGNRIQAGMAMPFVSLIWTDTALYQARYLRDATYVYGFDLLGTGCGLIGPNAAVRAGDSGSVFWLSSSRQFFMWNGGAPTVLQCPVREWMLDLLAPAQEDMIYAALNSQWNEVWWFFPDLATGENARYVAYNYVESHWTVGTYGITAWADRGVLQFPVAAHSDGSVKLHERGTTGDGDAINAYVESGFADVGDGDTLYRINRIVPEFHDLVGGVTITLTGRVWPQGTDKVVVAGTVGSSTTKLDTRMTARVVKVKMESTSSPLSWRNGRLGVDITPTGMKR